MNEEGGELAVLPSGTQIIPADRSEQLVNQIANNQNSARVEQVFSPNITISVSGGSMDDATVAMIEQRLMATMEERWREWNDDNYLNADIQLGNV